jgi:menaquinone-9 beta-reductase
MSAEVRDEAEIAVVGAGPTGSTAAAVLAEQGHDVLLLDKDEFPREKPCGDGLMHPAVAAAERLGLTELIGSRPKIEAARIVVAHRRHETTRLTSSPGRPHPRCIGRADFDAALLGSARAAGARFRRARVEGYDHNGVGRRLLAVDERGEHLVVRAGTVVAADGATSRLRRVTGAPSAPQAYAVRQYFVSQQPLDQVFDFFVPLEMDGRVLSGYGWVFPLDQHLANVGVGFYRDPRGEDPPLTTVLEAFVAELRLKARYGDLEAEGRPYGSPLGIRSAVEVAAVDGLNFAGDAAGTTHALTGEGIAFAMRGGEAVARALHARGRNGRRATLPALFPQLGVDTGMLNRTWTREMSKGSSGPTGSASKPFLGRIKQLVGESAYETGAEATPAWNRLHDQDPALAADLEAANARLMEELSTPLPFVKEVVHRSIRSHLGPIYAAIALGSTGIEGGRLPAAALDAAVASECVAVLPELLTMLVDRAGSKTLRVNNAFAILSADFAATRAMKAAARVGSEGALAISLACQRGCEGGMRDSSTRFAPNRVAESWFQAARETAGSAAVLATRLGAILAGEDPPSSSYGIDLGIAIRLAEEIVDLTVGPEAHPGREGADLRRGIYSLPVLYAIEADSQLPQLLARHTAEEVPAADVVKAVRESGGVERALAEAETRVEAAAAIAERLPGRRGEVLTALARVPADYLRAVGRGPAGALAGALESV